MVKRHIQKSDLRKIFIVPDSKKIMGLFQLMYKDYQDVTDKLIESFTATELKILEKYFLKMSEIMNQKIEIFK